MKIILRFTRIVAINVMMVIALLFVVDLIVTKLNLLPLKVKWQGSPVYGYSDSPVTFQDSTKKDSLTIVVIGDSHLAIAPDEKYHNQCYFLFDYLSKHHIPARVIAMGTGRTAPIQQMFMYDELINKKGIKPDIVLFQIYAGNDFSEILRADDRPRVDFKPDGTPYNAPIEWVFERPSDLNSKNFKRWPEDSRLLYLTSAVVGQQNILIKTVGTLKANELLHLNFSEKLEYIRNLRRFSDSRYGYPGAAAAQFLNQYYLMYKYHDDFMNEVRPRMRYFLENFKKSYLSSTCMFFYLPSAPAIGAMSGESNDIYLDILRRSNLPELNVREMEHSLYVMSDSINKVCGNPFLMFDMSEPIETANKLDGTQTFYDKPTLHVDVKARKVIGEYWAKEIIKCISKN